MVFLTLVIGVLNLFLGYALAVHMGQGPPGLRDAWDALSASFSDAPSACQAVPEPTIIDAWKVTLAREASKMAALRSQLRECEEQPDHEVTRRCAIELKEFCAANLQEQGEAAERFKDRFGESDELGTAGEDLEEAICEQLAQLETTISNLKQVDLESDLSAAGGGLLGEIERMLTASRRLWNGLHVEFSPSAVIEPD